MIPSRFDDIRPYHEHEIHAAMQRISVDPYFEVLAGYVFPERDIEDSRKFIASIDTIRDFQLIVMRAFNEQVLRRSVSEFSFDGLDGLDPSLSYLFVSNHRDIVLDSSLLQYALYLKGFETTDITFGANLMSSQLVVDIGRSNKMFRVERPSGSREFVAASRHLSDYIRTVVTSLGRSVWIAQRNGRTKNGIDATDPGIIKMFCFSSDAEPAVALDELRIVPVTVSYEWEPCDILKAVELYRRRDGKNYVKQPGEDLNSILTGILQPKGAVHFHIGAPVKFTEEPLLKGKSKNEFFRDAATVLDCRINSAYRLMPNNYIARDLLDGSVLHSNHYSDEERISFISRMDHLLGKAAEGIADKEELRRIFLEIYANPEKQGRQFGKGAELQ